MTYKAPHIERRLREYGEAMRSPIVLATGVRCTLARVVEMGANAGSFGSGADYDMVDDVPCRPDGGAALRYSQQRRETGEAIRADEVRAAVRDMRDPLWRTLVNVTWVDLPKGSEPRSERVAAEMMQISRDDYRLMRAAMLGYLEAVLYCPRPVFDITSDDENEEQKAA